ncbi:unnamed protein product [Mytilus edulis]|uniref:Uncharacterized protein n=1 Tax=Mytilus edulis TaxID=6550 RepID=A0A8S3PZN1_MYTED|nr:unnamed protein product [Mytilus edulis]
MFFAEVIVRNSAIASLVYFLAMFLPERRVDPPGIYEKPFKEMYDYIVGKFLNLAIFSQDSKPYKLSQNGLLKIKVKKLKFRIAKFVVTSTYMAYIPQGKVLGGSSSINAQVIVRGSRNNYDQWEHEGAVGWGYDDVLPFFRKLENATDTSYRDSSRQFSFNNICEFKCFIALRGLHGPIVIKEITGSILQSFHQTAAMEIGFSTVDCNSDDPIGFCKNQMNVKDGKRCSTSTCYLRPVLDRRNLQVSLRSRVTKIPLKVDLPVGQNLYDHLRFAVQYNITAPLNINRFFSRNGGEGLILQNVNPLYTGGPQIELLFTNNAYEEGIRFMRLLEQTEAWKSIGATLVRHDVPGHCSEQIYDSDNYWRCIGRHFLSTAYHFVGTCKMGSVNDPSVVVDSRLRVIGIKNLRVADASVMRYLPSGHTNAPAMMIGEKAADMIRRDRTHRYNILTRIDSIKYFMD